MGSGQGQLAIGNGQWSIVNRQSGDRRPAMNFLRRNFVYSSDESRAHSPLPIHH
jgi:hypothetical protein